jgi:hypothetical protein
MTRHVAKVVPYTPNNPVLRGYSERGFSVHHIECLSAKLFQEMITKATFMGMIPLNQFWCRTRENAMHDIRVLPDRVNVEDIIFRIVTYWHQTHPLHTDLNVRR